MKMYIKSVVVDDQAKAVEFYTQTLGFEVKHDIPMGEHRWLTLVSPEEPDGVELVLEPDAHPKVREFKQSMKSDGIPFTAFSVDDLEAEYDRLDKAGVVFTQKPTDVGTAKIAAFDDTCGNLIQLIELKG